MAFLSVVMCNYNHGRYITRAIEAVLSQSRPPDEFIILDDCSTDGSDSIIASYAARNSVINFHRNEQNLGALASIEKAIALVRGDYLYGAAADDYSLPGFFAEAMKMADQHPEAGIIFGPMLLVDPEGKECGRIEVTAWQTTRFVTSVDFIQNYLDQEAPGHSLCTSTIFRMQALNEVGGLRPELGHWCDTFAARAMALKYGACYLASTCAAWRIAPGSIANSSNQAPGLQLTIAARAATLMRSAEFHDRFPEEHIANWERRYYNDVLSLSRQSAPSLAKAIRDRLQPESVIEIGCGAGVLLKELSQLGIHDLCGVTDQKGPVAAIHPELAPIVTEHDFTTRFNPTKRYDLCLCLGTLSRMAPELEEQVIASCTAASNTILFAFPPRGGSGYPNRKSFEHWCTTLMAHGFTLTDSIRPYMKDAPQLWANDEMNVWLARQVAPASVAASPMGAAYRENTVRIEDLFRETLTVHELQSKIQQLSVHVDELNALLRNSATIPLPLKPEQISAEQGVCYTSPLRTRLGRFYSHLPLFAETTLQEDGVPLTQGNAAHADIRTQGKGRYSLWRDTIYFSTTDNSDPRTNGKSYTLLVPAHIFLMEGLPEQTIRECGI